MLGEHIFNRNLPIYFFKQKFVHVKQKDCSVFKLFQNE